MSKKEAIFLLILVVIIFSIYWSALNYELIWDSYIYINNNILLKENYPLSSALKFGFFQEQLGVEKGDNYYRPLLTASFMLENKLWGLNTAALRIANLIIFSLSLIFLFLFLKNQAEKKYFAGIATVLFALFPLHLDNIVWVVGRSELLMLLWASLSLLFLDYFIKKRKISSALFSSLFFLLGIFSKESFFLFLPLLLIYEWAKRKKISSLYHITNAGIAVFFFVVKIVILDIKNLKLEIPPNLFENAQTALGSIGYYFRCLAFPFSYDMFLPTGDILRPFFLISGIFFIVLLAYFFYKSKNNPALIFPLSLIGLFVGGHLILLFSSLFPFRLYSRYMMIPALGLAWILSIYLCRLKDKVKLLLASAISLLFIFSIIMNSSTYKSEVDYFKRAHRASPENSYILFQLAKAYKEKNDYLSAELYLNQALFHKQKKETAILVSSLYADIELKKAQYEKALKWVDSVNAFAIPGYVTIAPFTRFQLNHLEAKVYALLGRTELAEKLFKENIKTYKNIKESYLELYRMYTGHTLWEKAYLLEEIIKTRFPSLKDINTSETQNEFNSSSLEEKIKFYILNKNFLKAISLLSSKSPLEINDKILLARLHIWGGKEQEGRRIIAGVLSERPHDFQLFNTIGNVYLREFHRVKESLEYYQKSLEINKNQPDIQYRIHELEANYLNRLKDTRM